MQARFAHTNLIARDWRLLANFYERVFGCTRLSPERDLSGSWLDAATRVPGARIQGAHLRLPGHGDSGPTLEIFQYSPEGPDDGPLIHRRGFAHVAFAVDDVDAARRDVVAAGGHEFGELVSVRVGGAGVVTFVYVTDPEGNIIELQAWQNA